MSAGEPTEYRVLGPLEVATGSRHLEVAGVRQQVVLAMLLLSPNRVVSVARLEAALYGAEPPSTSRAQVQISISSLRRLTAVAGQPPSISRQAGGYVFQLGAGRLDLLLFDELVSAARAARDAGDAGRAVARYREAQRLWRGPALEGIDSELVRAAAVRLDERRITAHEDRLALELDLGRHHELVEELDGLVEEHPLRERLRGQLMLALYRSGREAESLEVYQRARRTLIEELGIEPGRQLQDLQRAILNRERALDPPSAPVAVTSAPRHVPRLLPADIADFTGRDGQVRHIREQLTAGADRGPRLTAPVLVVTGTGGVGKTSLAVHAAHGVAGRFRDGQLFADLHGGTANPVGPAHVLERFLRALGMPGTQIPETLDERAEAYRSLLAGRQMLVVLDDAVTESQVSPLLPGGGTAAVLVTSRRKLTGLPGALRIEVDVLDPAHSVDLLGRITGAARVHAQASAASAVAAQCGHLPLALRIAGARLAARPHWDVRQLADRLTDEARRLDELQHGEMGVRASISLGYQGVSEQARVLLRRLALVRAPVFSGWISAPLLDQSPALATDVLDELVTGRLVEVADEAPGVQSQYRLHELIRVFAQERLAAEEPARESGAALERALGALLHLASEARDRYRHGGYLPLDTGIACWQLPGPLTDELIEDPLAWYERERTALVSGVRQAAEAGLAELCWSLTLCAESLFDVRGYRDDRRDTVAIALEVTRAAGHDRGQAAMHHQLAYIHIDGGQFEVARQDLDTAARLFQAAGDDLGVALVVRDTAWIERLTGQFDAAAAAYERALGMIRKAGDQVALASTLQGLARLKMMTGQTGAADELLAEALPLAETFAGTRIRAQVLNTIGDARLQAGQPAAAEASFRRALADVRQLGDQIGESHVLRGVAVAALRQGEFGLARSALESALELGRVLGNSLAIGWALAGLSELALAAHEPGRAVVVAQQAADTFRDMGARLEESRALALVSAAHRALGDNPAAEAAAKSAAALSASVGATPQPSPS